MAPDRVNLQNELPTRGGRLIPNPSGRELLKRPKPLASSAGRVINGKGSTDTDAGGKRVGSAGGDEVMPLIGGIGDEVVAEFAVEAGTGNGRKEGGEWVVK